MMRRGTSGTASELLSPAQRDRIDAFCRETLHRLGSDFPYDERYAGAWARRAA